MVPSWDLEGFSAGKCFHLSNQQIKYNVFQREIMAAMEKLHPLIGKCKGGSSWHDDTGLFLSGTEVPHGLLNLSPTWFQQGHDVSCFSLSDSSLAADFNLDSAAIPQVGSIFKKPAALEWLDAIS
jgi:hypothetical protein